MITLIHPRLSVVVREDGYVLNMTSGSRKRNWTKGNLNRYTGYYSVNIKGRNYGVNRLVAETFIPNPDDMPIVLHINHIRGNNCIENLRWAAYNELIDNTEKVHRELLKYGVRRCDDPREYSRKYQEELRERAKRYPGAHRPKPSEFWRRRREERLEYWKQYRENQKLQQQENFGKNVNI